MGKGILDREAAWGKAWKHKQVCYVGKLLIVYGESWQTGLMAESSPWYVFVLSVDQEQFLHF